MGGGPNLTAEPLLPTRADWEADHVEAAVADAALLKRVATSRRSAAILGTCVLAVVAVIAGVVLVARHNVRTLTIPFASMEPTLRVGQGVTFEPGDFTPAVGDIVLFHPPVGALDQVCGAPQTPGEACPTPTPQDAANLYVKRIVAGPGDTVAIESGHVIRNGQRQREPFASVAGCNATAADCNYPKPITIPSGYYFVLGDNRDFSDDSRFWGPVPRNWIIGTAVHCTFFDVFCSPGP